MTRYQVIELDPAAQGGFAPRGGARELWYCKDHEVILAGPAETGKTYSSLKKLNAWMWKYPGAQAAMVRKTYKSCVGSVCQSFERKVANMTAVQTLGGTKPERYIYPNGSVIWIGGMDNPDKVLSSERDFIYCNQVEEFDLSDWETLATRCTGRAGNAPYSQLMGDCNPASPYHWIKARAGEGKLTLLKSIHQDNPSLFDEAGVITEQGERTLAILANLTGLRRKRLYEGLWVQAEGVIYDTFDDQIHVIGRFEIPASWRRFRVVDFGYTKPFVCQWWAIDHDDNLYRYREIYFSHRTVRVHAEKIRDLSRGETIEATVCDHDAEDRATLEENGIPTQAADKTVSVGIEKVKERLKVGSNGKPRIFFLRDSLVETDETLVELHKPVCTEQEFGGYVWNDKAKKEEPIKKDDHGMDDTRYAVMYADEGSPNWEDVKDLGHVSGYRNPWE